MKKLLILFLTLAIIISGFAVYSAETDSSKYTDNVNLLCGIGILDGTYKSMYAEDTEISYALLKKVTAEFAGVTSDNTDSRVADFNTAVYEVLKMIGYEVATDGGRDLKIAYTLGIMKGVKAENKLTSGNFAQMLINALDVKILEGYTTSGEAKFEPTESYSQRNKINKVKGVIEATDRNSIIYGDDKIAGGYVKISGVLYKTNSDLSDMLGYMITFWTKHSADGEYDEIISISEISNNIEITIADKDIKTATLGYITYYAENNKTEKVKLAEDYIYIYNGRAKLTKKAEELKPENGFIRLLDSNGDGEYDLVFITSYSVCIYGGYDSTTGKLYDNGGNVILDASSDEYVLSVKLDGKESAVESFPEKSIIYIAVDDSGKYGSIIASSKKVKGEVTQIGDDNTCRISDETFEIGNRMEGKIKINQKGTFYIGPTGKVEHSVAGGIGSYGILIAAHMEEHFESEITIRLYTQEGKLEDLKLAEKAVLYSENGSEKIGSAQVARLKSYAQDALGANTDGIGGGKAAPIVMYTMSRGEIKTISLPVAFDEENSGSKRSEYTLEAVVSDTTKVNKRFRNLYRNGCFNPTIYNNNETDATYKFLSADTIVFNIPININGEIEEGYEDEITVMKGNRWSYEAWSYESCYNLGDDLVCGAIVQYNSGGSSTATGMLIKTVEQCINNEGEATVKIGGLVGKTEVEYICDTDATIDNGIINAFLENTIKVTPQTLKVGDVVSVATNGKGYASTIKMLVRGSSGKEAYKRMHNSAYYESNNEVIIGTVCRKEGSMMMIEVDSNGLFANILKFPVNNYGSCPIYLCDSKNRKYETTTAATIQIGDTVYVRMNMGLCAEVGVLR